MKDDWEDFDQVFGRAPEEGGPAGATPPLLRRTKTRSQQVGFWLANVFLMPLVALCYLILSAEGLRRMLPIFSQRLSKLPLPGADRLRNYSGWDQLDLSILVSLLLFVAVTYLWTRLFSILMSGELLARRDQNPILFFLLSGIAAVIICCDAALFYFGVESRTASGWSGESSAYAPILATTVFVASLAGVGAWHADYHTSGTV